MPILEHKITRLGNVDGLSRGTIKLESTVDGITYRLTIKDVVYAPNAPHNLISISHMTQAGFAVLFSGNKAHFWAPGGAVIAEGQEHGQLFLMDIKGIARHDQAYVARSSHTWDEWHKIFRHLNMG